MTLNLIKNPIFLWISVILFIVFGYFLYDRVGLLLNAERTIGKVQTITAANSRCGSGRKSRSKYPCTKYSANVLFKATSGESSTFSLGAGKVRGHNQPLQYSSIAPGDPIKVLYDTRNITKAYQDTLIDVWGTPILVLIFQIATLFGAMTNPKRRSY